MDDYLQMESVEPIARCFFSSGAQLDLSREQAILSEQIRAIEPRDVEGYRAFLKYAARLHRIVAPVFIYDKPPGLRSLLRVAPVDALSFDGLRTMSQAINSYVHAPELRQLLGIFATYVGASPYRAPATLNVIAHVELNEGVWYPKEGVYSIAQAYMKLAQELGVEIMTNSRVARIEQLGGLVRGIALEDGSRIEAGAIVANVDVRRVSEDLLTLSKRTADSQIDAEKIKGELSCSAFVMLLGVRGVRPELVHHNTFFSADYAREFDEIFTQGRPPSDPTIYISITSRSTPADAPVGRENWFIQINAPAIGDEWDWEEQAQNYADLVLNRLAERGMDIREQIEYCKIMTPLDLERDTGAWRGALYGVSSNYRWAAFRRPHNRSRRLKGLYFAGGTTHPGGGVPMVMLSGKVASQMLIEDSN